MTQSSNYGMLMSTLFCQGVPEGCSVFRMEADDQDREAAALRYDIVLPDSIDILLLGVGKTDMSYPCFLVARYCGNFVGRWCQL